MYFFKVCTKPLLQLEMCKLRVNLQKEKTDELTKERDKGATGIG